MDLTTIGVKVGYAVETVKGTKPAAFTWLKRCKAVGGINLEQDRIDVTALEDKVKQYAEGVADTGGSWPLTFGMNDDVITALEAFKTASATGKADGLATWVNVWFPGLKKSFFVKATPPALLPMPEVGQGSPAELKINCVINEYMGLDAAIEPTEAGA